MKYTKVIVFIALVIGIALRISMFSASVSNLPVTSDEASSVLLAESIAQGQRPLLFIGQPYQFPFESYVSSLYVDHFPHSVYLARAQGILLNLLAVLFLILAARKIFRGSAFYPVFLLLLIPSSYWLIYQSAYTHPQYGFSAFIDALLIFTAASSLMSPRNAKLMFFVGLLGGLALSNHLLNISVVAAVFIFMLLRDHNWASARLSGLLVLGLIVGLSPYIAGEIFVPGANTAVSNLNTLPAAISSLFHSVLVDTLPGAMGIDPPVFPDLLSHTGWPSWTRGVFLVFYLVALGSATLIRLRDIFSDIKQKHMPDWLPIDIFLFISFSAIILKSLSSVGFSISYRLLLPVVWSFPFILGFLFSRTTSNGRFRPALWATATALVLVNIVSSLTLLHHWRDRDGLRLAADTPDIGKVIGNLKSNNDQFCYASFWVAYRIIYESSGNIICSMPYNERFPGWPLTYKAIVDEQPNVPYITSMSESSLTRSIVFLQQMVAENIAFAQEALPPYTIFRNFDKKQPEIHDLPDERVTLSASDASPGAMQLADNSIHTKWRSSLHQHPGMFIQVHLDSPEKVARISLVYASGAPAGPRSFRLWALSDGVWKNVLVWRAFPSSIKFYKGKPVYDLSRMTVHGRLKKPVMTDSLKIEIIHPAESSAWELADIKIGII